SPSIGREHRVTAATLQDYKNEKRLRYLNQRERTARQSRIRGHPGPAHGGANVHQSFDDSCSIGDTSLHLDHNVGGYGGIKLGYVFGTDTYRFALEEDPVLQRPLDQLPPRSKWD